MMSHPLQPRLRAIKAQDIPALVRLFQDTVHQVNAKDYAPEQLLAWAPQNIDPNQARWQSLVDNIAYLVEIDKVIVGFADMTSEGYIDRLFVHKDYQGQGIAKILLQKLESEARRHGIRKITAEVSITAKPLVERFGASIVREQYKCLANGRTLRNFVIEKRLEARLVHIDFLNNHPDGIAPLARIWQQVLGRIWSPEISLEQIEARFQTHVQEESLPLSLVAFCDAQPVGMCSLRNHDGIRPDLTPWLGSLVVHPDYQREGIGLKLINAVKTAAKNLGFQHLYLFTFDPTLPSYYAKLGWNLLGEEDFEGRKALVMDIAL